MIKIHTDRAPAAVGPYSQAVVSNGMVYTSGQIAINPETNTVEAQDIKGQTEQIMKNLRCCRTPTIWTPLKRL